MNLTSPPAAAPAPKDPGWTFIGEHPPGCFGYQLGRVCVICSIDKMELPAGGGQGDTWLISITSARPSGNVRAKEHEVRRALRAFGMEQAEEDNHHPGKSRAFFLPVDPKFRGICECKTDEQVVVEPDGYTWTNPKPETGEDCRGCEYHRNFGRACPIHREVADR